MRETMHVSREMEMIPPTPDCWKEDPEIAGKGPDPLEPLLAPP